MRNKKSGFTLIELSIVLVIIGLIVGGVLTGRDLIEAAKIRSVISDLDKYKAAVNTFRTKYNCIPGDCANATDFFGGNGIGSACTGSTWGWIFGGQPPAPWPTTCNGNGDGFINNNGNNVQSAAVENSLFWDHLSKAGLISGEGFTLSCGGGCNMGASIPAALSGVFTVAWMDNSYGTNSGGVYHVWPAMFNHHLFYYGGSPVTATMAVSAGAGQGKGGATAIQALAIDTKMDDGLPGSGAVFAAYAGGLENNGTYLYLNGIIGTGCNNSNKSDPTIGNSYMLSDTTADCNMAFFAGF